MGEVMLLTAEANFDEMNICIRAYANGHHFEIFRNKDEELEVQVDSDSGQSASFC